MTTGERSEAPRGGAANLWRRIRSTTADLMSKPCTDYFMIFGIIIVLAALGVVMVFSSSMTWSVLEGHTVWGTALQQGLMVVAGFAAMWVAMAVRPVTIRRLALILLVFTIFLLVLVLVPGVGTGREEVGSQSWIVLGPLRLQPSEVAKVTLAVWGASILADARPGDQIFKGRLYLFGAVSGVILTLVLAQSDVGMAVAIFIVVAFMLLFAGVHTYFIAGLGIMAFLGLVTLMFTGGFRSDRFTTYFHSLVGDFADTRGKAYQSYQGFLSLADGGFGGVGLGQSRAKWFYLPEAKNDFIFAVIGEELGLWGGAAVIILFGLLCYFGVRVAMKSSDRFMSLMAATLTGGVTAQAFINIGYVIGLLPVTGIQLPMISSGGTSAIITLGSMGLLANCARHEPEAISAMQSYGRPVLDRILLLREPESPRTYDARSIGLWPSTYRAGAAPAGAKAGAAPAAGYGRGARVTSPRRWSQVDRGGADAEPRYATGRGYTQSRRPGGSGKPGSQNFGHSEYGRYRNQHPHGGRGGSDPNRNRRRR